MPWRRGGFVPYCGKHSVMYECFKKRESVAERPFYLMKNSSLKRQKIAKFKHDQLDENHYL